MSRYQKKHSPTHQPDHHPMFISFFHLLRSIASSLFKLCAWQSEKKLVKQQYLLHMSPQLANFGPLTAEIGLPVWGTQQISNGFTSCYRYWNDFAHRRPTKLCTMFGRLLGWYTVYTFSGALVSRRHFARCKIHFTSESCILLYWQRYCTPLQQRLSAKLRNMVQGRELWNFRRGQHLYSAGWP